MKLKTFYKKIEKNHVGKMKVNLYKFLDHLISKMRKKYKINTEVYIDWYLKKEFPRLLSSSRLSDGLIEIMINIPHDDEDALIAYYDNRDKKSILLDVIKMDSWGDWDFEVIIIKAGYFKIREEFDKLISKRDDKLYFVDRIEIENALERAGIRIIVNKENVDFSECQGTEEETKKKIIKKAIIKIFGDGFHYKKDELIFQDFKILREDGNIISSSMKFKEFYLAFLFGTS
jgi:hypothetical protein